MDVPRHSFFEKELELRLSRSYGPGRYDTDYEEKGNDYPIGYVRWTEKRNMEAFLRLIAEGKINTNLLTTHRFAVAQAMQAYDLIMSGSERFCGVVLEYPSHEHPILIPKRDVRPPAKPGSTGISFIGAGNFARGVLLPIVKRSDKVQLLGVSAATGLSARNSAEQFGFSYSTTDVQEILGDPESQVVFIATRHDSHANLAADALRRGKHVFVEKPLAITLDGLREVTAAARESDGLLMVGFNRRFALIAKEIKARFENRAAPMTIVYRVNAGQLPQNHWNLDPAEGGGRIIGEACHFIDLVQYLTGALPRQASAQAVQRSSEGSGADDSTVISLNMADGSIASIIYTAGGDPSVAKERIEIFCDRSVATIDDFRTGTFTRDRKTAKLGSSTQDKGHASEVAAFLNAARGLTAAPIELESLLATTLASFAAVESAKNGGAISVDLSDVWA
jgi:polar amino acid transport system substrate-binding protein